MEKSSEMNFDGDIVFDSLPYIDGSLDLEQAHLLIRKEMQSHEEEEDYFVLFQVREQI